MSVFLRRACIAALLAASGLANATTYNFAYTFDTGLNMTGSFDGTVSATDSNLITGLSHISVFYNGTPFDNGSYANGALNNFGFNGSYWDQGSAVVSIDGTANNFLFSNSFRNPSGGWYYVPIFLSLTNGMTTDVHPAQAILPSQFSFNQNKYDQNGYSATRWSVTAVPEPATYAMLLAGLALTAGVARRRAARS